MAPAVGSRVAFVAHFLGRRLAYTYEVTELVPGECFVQRTMEGPFPMETTYTWEDNPAGGTRMKLRNRGEPSGFSSFAAPMMAAVMRRANQKDLARLKAILSPMTIRRAMRVLAAEKLVTVVPGRETFVARAAP